MTRGDSIEDGEAFELEEEEELIHPPLLAEDVLELMMFCTKFLQYQEDVYCSLSFCFVEGGLLWRSFQFEMHRSTFEVESWKSSFSSALQVLAFSIARKS